jgi:hypothetical protein
MTNYCTSLNLNINPVNIDHNYLKEKYLTRIEPDQLNLELITLLKNHDIEITYSESFYSPPGFVQQIHTDEYGGDYVKLNFIYGGAGSQMHWYQIKNTVESQVMKKTATNKNYISWNADQVDLIESNSLIYPSLIQVGCPHNIINKDQHRLCITLVLCDAISTKRLTMSEAQLKLNKFLV